MTSLLSRRELADYFGVSTRTIDYWCATRALPFVRIGSRKRFRLEDIERYMIARTFGLTASRLSEVPGPDALSERG